MPLMRILGLIHYVLTAPALLGVVAAIVEAVSIANLRSSDPDVLGLVIAIGVFRSGRYFFCFPSCFVISAWEPVAVSPLPRPLYCACRWRISLGTFARRLNCPILFDRVNSSFLGKHDRAYRRRHSVRLAGRYPYCACDYHGCPCKPAIGARHRTDNLIFFASRGIKHVVLMTSNTNELQQDLS